MDSYDQPLLFDKWVKGSTEYSTSSMETIRDRSAHMIIFSR